MDDHLWMCKPPWCVTSHPGQLILLPSAGLKMSSSQSVMMLCNWRIKADMAYSIRGCMYGCDPSLTHAILEHLKGELSQYKALYKCPVYSLMTVTWIIHLDWIDFWLVLVAVRHSMHCWCLSIKPNGMIVYWQRKWSRYSSQSDVCLCLWIITSELNDLWPRYLVYWFPWPYVGHVQRSWS